MATTDVDGAVETLLTSSSAVQSAAPGGVWWDQAPLGAGEPYIVLTVVDDSDRWALGLAGGVRTIRYMLRVVADGQKSRSRANVALDAADSVLHKKSPTVPGYSQTNIIRVQGGRRYTDQDGFYNHAVYYQMVLS